MKLFVDVHGMSLCLRHKSMHICKFLDCCFNIGNVMCLESHSFQNIQAFYWFNPRMHFIPDHMWSACDSFVDIDSVLSFVIVFSTAVASSSALYSCSFFTHKSFCFHFVAFDFEKHTHIHTHLLFNIFSFWFLFIKSQYKMKIDYDNQFFK